MGAGRLTLPSFPPFPPFSRPTQGLKEPGGSRWADSKVTHTLTPSPLSFTLQSIQAQNPPKPAVTPSSNPFPQFPPSLNPKTSRVGSDSPPTPLYPGGPLIMDPSRRPGALPSPPPPPNPTRAPVTYFAPRPRPSGRAAAGGRVPAATSSRGAPWSGRTMVGRRVARRGAPSASRTGGVGHLRPPGWGTWGWREGESPGVGEGAGPGWGDRCQDTPLSPPGPPPAPEVRD